MKIKRLDTEYKLNSHILKLRLRTENVACYNQFTKDGKLVGVELFKIKERPKEQIGDVEYPHREVYPSTSDWGASAWTLRFNETEENITRRVQELQKEIDNEKNNNGQ